MSRPEHIEKEKQGLPGRNRTETREPSRRRFIRNMAIGTAGAAITMGSLDRLRGASRLLERLTEAHVDGFMAHIKDFSGSPQAKQEFERISKLILETVGNDQKSLDTYHAIKHYLAHPAVQPPEGSTFSDVDLVLGAGYLRALEGIQHSTRRVSADDVMNRLRNPKAILHIFESGFLNQLYVKAKAESTSSPAFAKRLADASGEAKGAAGRVGKATTTEARLVPAGFFQCGPDDCFVAIANGTGGSSGCATWELCVAIVVILVVVAILK